MTHQKALIIAEAGVNHNGDVDLARRLVDASADAGADVVKFQTFSAKRLVTVSAQKAAYQKLSTAADESQHEMIRRLEMDHAMHEAVIKHCADRGIEFLSTGFDIESNSYLNTLGLKRMKVPSGEITNLPYLRQIGSLGLPIILSTGMANLGEIEAALAVLEQSGAPRNTITVLHCTTEYPAPMADVNLRAMVRIGEAFGVSVGYSDHTDGIEVPVAAVALGGVVIEKHITIDRSLPGPDQKASLEPETFKNMVAAIRNIERALGDGIKRPSASEVKNKPIVRKSLVAADDIKAGELFTPANMAAKRPGNGLSPMLWDDLIGKPAKRDFAADELLEL